MKISGKTLLAIDRLFWLPYKLAEFFIHDLRPGEKPGKGIVVIKFMGLGSIVRLAALCEKRHVDKSRITLLTLASNKELCQRVGFGNILLVRTGNLFFVLKRLLDHPSLCPSGKTQTDH